MHDRLGEPPRAAGAACAAAGPSTRALSDGIYRRRGSGASGERNRETNRLVTGCTRRPGGQGPSQKFLRAAAGPTAPHSSHRVAYK
ncbi:hypothetical protein EVAR_89489_1 [Eumeta japonica]|uniref:Uncharacterized protein n=1 Tax=Eumeta variegata TaxID=151549 RepID=A0A4C1XJQ7_EUMVA|nr:hypothetical protein EVAR_89489_1 [Eumeta japonica]